MDPFLCDEIHILNFLAEKFDAGASYGTLNGFRSAISKSHCGFNGVPAGSSSLVRRLMKGAFNVRPPLPRYSEFWDVGQLIGCLKTLPPPESLSPLQLAQKLAALLSLSSLCRVSSLAAVSCNYDIIRDEGGGAEHICLRLLSLEKNSRPGCVRSEVRVSNFLSGADLNIPALDIAAYLQAYLDSTAGMRQAHLDHTGHLPPTLFIANSRVSS